MKAKYEHINPSFESSFTFRMFEEKAFGAPYHFHPEYELTLIVSSGGKRFVGNHIGDFAPGDLVLLGANLPHCWRNEQPSQVPAAAVVVQFRDDFMGGGFLQKPELSRVAGLLALSRAGVRFFGKNAQNAAHRMQEMTGQAGFRRLMQLLETLHELAASDEFELLDNEPVASRLSSADCDRIHRVHGFVMENFRQEVSLAQVADLVCMTPEAFCRYFKRVTHRTFFQMLTDYRLRHACRLLAETSQPVAEVAFGSGFGNVSHFNQQFKATLKLTPGQYRRSRVMSYE